MIAMFGLLFSMLIGLDALNNGLRRQSIVALALAVAVHFAAGCGSQQHKSDARDKKAGSAPNSNEDPVVLPGQVAVGGGEMRLDLSNAVALAVTDGTPAATTQAGTVNAKTALKLDGEEDVNLMKITVDGRLEPAFAAKHKDVKIKNTWFRKNVVFIEFEKSVLMETKESLEARKRREVIAGIYCNLGYATKEDPTVQCIKGAGGSPNLADPIQVDGDGNVFYIGGKNGGNLRKFNVNTQADLEIVEVNVNFQYVLNERGDLFFRSGSVGEILGVLKSGANKPEKVSTKAAVLSLEVFPDGLTYFQERRFDAGMQGIALVRLNEDGSTEDVGIFEKGTMGAYDGCQGEKPINIGQTVAAIPVGECTPQIIVYWPEHRIIPLKTAAKFINGTKVKANSHLNLNTPSAGRLYDNNGNDTMLIAVEDSTGKPKLISVNLLTGEERDAVPASLDLQVVNMSASGNDVYFSAYKASEQWGLTASEFTMGKIDLQANTVTTSNTPVSISSIEHL